MHCDTLKQDNDSTVRGNGGSRVGEVRAGTTSPIPEHKGFMLQQLSRDPPTHTSSLMVSTSGFHKVAAVQVMLYRLIEQSLWNSFVSNKLNLETDSLF